MTQKKAPWRPDRATAPSTRPMELAVELAKRINREMLASLHQNGSSAQPSSAHELLMLKGISLNEGTWSPTSFSSDAKTEQSGAEIRRPFSCKGIRPLSKEKNSPASNPNVNRPRSVAPRHASLELSHETPRAAPRTNQITLKKVQRKVGPSRPEPAKGVIRNQDPDFDALFVAGKEEPEMKYDYLDPFPDDFRSFRGNMLQKMKYFKDNVYALKLIELEKVLNVTLEWENQSNNRTKPGNNSETVNPGKGNSKDIRKTKSFEMLSDEKRVSGSKSEEDLNQPKIQTSRTKVLATRILSTDTDRENSRTKTYVSRKQSWRADLSTNAAREVIHDVWTSSRNFEKPVRRNSKIGGKGKEADGRSGISDTKNQRFENDPAKVFKNSGMKKYLALQKSYWEAQVKQSRKLFGSSNIKSVGDGQRESRKLSVVGPTAPTGPLKAIKKRNSARSTTHNDVISEKKSFSASGNRCHMYQPRRAKSSAKEMYDIKDVAYSFDPPCQDQLKKRTTSASGVSNMHNLQPGKSFHSQRRVSLTKPKRPKTSLSRSNTRK